MVWIQLRSQDDEVDDATSKEQPCLPKNIPVSLGPTSSARFAGLIVENV
jgi:hypothetical protein